MIELEQLASELPHLSKTNKDILSDVERMLNQMKDAERTLQSRLL